jgi:uncharacterized protein (TIGR04168 family)
VGYGQLDLPELGLAVVGGRPFSWGGPEWKNASFYQERYGIGDFAASTARINAAIDRTRQDTLLFIGHCGPTGLGDQAHAPCGRDWKPLGGDFGDPDLTPAIAHARSIGKQIPLVAFGHMHHTLRHTRERLRERVSQDAAGTLYLNAACVPRIVQKETGKYRSFSLVSLQAGQILTAALVWLDPMYAIASNETLYTAVPNPSLAKTA